jgi:hypothetical protein
MEQTRMEQIRMEQIRAEYANLVPFVPARSTSTRVVSNKRHRNPSSSFTSVSGVAARSFYEDLVLETPTSQKHVSSNISSPKRECRPANSADNRDDTYGGQYAASTSDHQTDVDPSPDVGSKKSAMHDILLDRPTNQLLSYAQDGNLRCVRRLVESGVKVDVRDAYGWTPLHCAAHSGHMTVVQYLVDHGARIFIHDKQGRTPQSLAQKAKHSHVVTFLEQCKTPIVEKVSTGPDTMPTNYIHCSVCKTDILESARLDHETSTVHLFNRKLTPKTVNYFVPPSNVGYQLMKKSGWNENKGLGPDGQGQKYPVKTILKRDRRCLGSEDKGKKAKISHFGAKDLKAIEHIQQAECRVMNVKTLSKRAHQAKERKAKLWEKNMRQYLNSE